MLSPSLRLHRPRVRNSALADVRRRDTTRCEDFVENSSYATLKPNLFNSLLTSENRSSPFLGVSLSGYCYSSLCQDAGRSAVSLLLFPRSES